jgi:hypothetical protein
MLVSYLDIEAAKSRFPVTSTLDYSYLLYQTLYSGLTKVELSLFSFALS